ncbi:uncharacterized protein LOC132207501 [Stegostoma tigrinum]|uniref:uncharacterized protein LOC132207501 n=1 Tax=Stegostoma tigrinum TaxID=3053191 RepID=UPI0028701722|nr:uncharacterized protein LOC132207501 [Stegostoma tigrinum]
MIERTEETSGTLRPSGRGSPRRGGGARARGRPRSHESVRSLSARSPVRGAIARPASRRSRHQINAIAQYRRRYSNLLVIVATGMAMAVLIPSQGAARVWNVMWKGWMWAQLQHSKPYNNDMDWKGLEGDGRGAGRWDYGWAERSVSVLDSSMSLLGAQHRIHIILSLQRQFHPHQTRLLSVNEHGHQLQRNTNQINVQIVSANRPTGQHPELVISTTALTRSPAARSW